MFGLIQPLPHRVAAIFTNIRNFAVFLATRFPGDYSGIRMSRRAYNFLFPQTAFAADMVPQTVPQTGCFPLDNPLAEIVPRCPENGFRQLFPADGTQIIRTTILRTGRLLRQEFAETVPRRFRVIGSVPFAANRAGVFRISPFGTIGRNDYRVTIDMSLSFVLPDRMKRHVLRRRHAVGISLPAEENIPPLFGHGRRDRLPVRQRIGVERRNPVFIQKYNRIYPHRPLDNRAGNDVLRRGRGHGVRYAVAVQIPTNQSIVISLVGSDLVIRLPDDLRGEIIPAVQNAPVRPAEDRRNPLPSIIDGIPVDPIRIIVVPHDVLLVHFRIDRDARDSLERISASDLYPLFQDNRPQGDRNVRNIITEIPVNVIRRHLRDHQCFKICER